MTKVEDLNNTMTQQQQQLTKKATLEAIARAQDQGGDDYHDDDIAGSPVIIQAPARLPGADDSAAGSKGLSVTGPKVASLARETSFAHQQSIISELQTKLSQEITEKEELITLKEELLVRRRSWSRCWQIGRETIETMRLEGAVFEHPSPSKGSSHAMFDHPGSRPSSGLGLLDEVDVHDRRDLSMALSENDSQDFSTGRGSPFPNRRSLCGASTGNIANQREDVRGIQRSRGDDRAHRELDPHASRGGHFAEAGHCFAECCGGGRYPGDCRRHTC